jgi:hypothetical protein
VGTVIPIPEPSVAVAVFIALILIAAAQPTPQPKIGACPSGYRESGGYCAPTSDRAPVAVPKGRSVSVELGAVRRLLGNSRRLS